MGRHRDMPFLHRKQTLKRRASPDVMPAVAGGSSFVRIGSLTRSHIDDALTGDPEVRAAHAKAANDVRHRRPPIALAQGRSCHRERQAAARLPGPPHDLAVPAASRRGQQGPAPATTSFCRAVPVKPRPGSRRGAGLERRNTPGGRPLSVSPGDLCPKCSDKAPSASGHNVCEPLRR